MNPGCFRLWPRWSLGSQHTAYTFRTAFVVHMISTNPHRLSRHELRSSYYAYTKLSALTETMVEAWKTAGASIIFHQSSAPKHRLFYLWILLWQNAWFLKLLFELLALVSQKLPHEFLFGIRTEFPPIFWNVLEHTSVSLGYIFMRNEYQPQNSNRVWKTIKERGVEGETAEPQSRAEGITAWNFTNT